MYPESRGLGGGHHVSKSLYERPGRAEGIVHIVDDVMAAHPSNPTVKTRFEIIRV
jgi:hypothetical protein